MKTKVRPARNGNGGAAVSQPKIHQSRAGQVPRKLPVDWSERYIAKEFKVVALRECPLSSALHVCDTADKAAEYWRLNIATNPYFNSECECMVVLILTTRRHVKGHQLVTIGTLDSVLAHPREIFRTAIVASAAAVILMYNHPSGDPVPSEDDIRVTRNLARAGELIKIEVLDHVIMGQQSAVCPRGLCSLRELGYFCGINGNSDLEPRASKRARRSIKRDKPQDQRRAA